MNALSKILILTSELATLSHQAGIRDQVTDDIKAIQHVITQELDRLDAEQEATLL